MYVFSGVNWQLLRTYTGEIENGRFGRAVTAWPTPDDPGDWTLCVEGYDAASDSSEMIPKSWLFYDDGVAAGPLYDGENSCHEAYAGLPCDIQFCLAVRAATQTYANRMEEIRRDRRANDAKKSREIARAKQTQDDCEADADVEYAWCLGLGVAGMVALGVTTIGWGSFIGVAAVIGCKERHDYQTDGCWNNYLVRVAIVEQDWSIRKAELDVEAEMAWNVRQQAIDDATNERTACIRNGNQPVEPN